MMEAASQASIGRQPERIKSLRRTKLGLVRGRHKARVAAAGSFVDVTSL